MFAVWRQFYAQMVFKKTKLYYSTSGGFTKKHRETILKLRKKN